jgi:hypothetical protein
MIKIDKKIVGYSVVSKDEDTLESMDSSSSEELKAHVPPPSHPEAPPAEVMSETYKRPDMANGSTYRIKTPLFDSAMYITINDVVLNPNTAQEHIRPLEMFINSKEMSQFQWIVALTRIISAVFRKGGDMTFLVDELKSVFDPKGGYFKKGKYIPSLVAEIGGVLEEHLISRGLMEPETLDAATKDYLKAKKQEALQKIAEATKKSTTVEVADDAVGTDDTNLTDTADSTNNTDEEALLDNALLCPKCHTKAMIMMGGCLTCLECGDSKCS